MLSKASTAMDGLSEGNPRDADASCAGAEVAGQRQTWTGRAMFLKTCFGTLLIRIICLSAPIPQLTRRPAVVNEA